MKTFLIINPMSANGQTGKRWAEIGAQISRYVGDCGQAFTRGSMDAATLTTQALHDGYDCIVTVGGDGTINEVVNGFFERDKVINPAAALAVIPRGTGGDFRKTFGWSTDLQEAVARLATDKTAPFDVGRVELTTHTCDRTSRYFANICSFGVSGQVDAEVNRSSKILGGKLSFMIGSVRALLRYSDRTVRVSVDGKPPTEMAVTTLAVANGRYFGGGMMVAPDANTSDGLFDVTIWSGYGLVDFALKSKSIYDGSHTKWSGTRQLRCKTLEAMSNEEVLVDIDGEQPGRLPCKVTILPSAIRLKI